MKNLIIYSDGGARGNPGPAAIGVVLLDDKGGVVESFGRYIGETTNNQAEYQALIAGLRAAKKHEANSVKCYLDSELIVKQMRGEYRVKDADLKKLYAEAKNFCAVFSKVHFAHISRDRNKSADRLVNQALDKANG